jgi:hypothetical protein
VVHLPEARKRIIAATKSVSFLARVDRLISARLPAGVPVQEPSTERRIENLNALAAAFRKIS